MSLNFVKITKQRPPWNDYQRLKLRDVRYPRVGTHLEAQVTTAFFFLSSINALPSGKGHTNKVSYLLSKNNNNNTNN